MELRHLRYFVAVAEEMNVHRAAERLHISQPPLSLTIKQLEEEVGVQLFTREGRGIQITRAGTVYLARARQILADAKAASEEARQSSEGIIGTLRIGFISSSISGILQNTVAAYKVKYPKVTLDMNQSINRTMAVQILERRIDVGIIRLPEKIPEGIIATEVARESWFAAIPKGHHFVSQKDIAVKDLKDERLIFYPRSNTASGYDDVMQIFSEKEIVPNIYQEATEQMTIAGLVASGMGIGIVPECMAQIKVPNVVHRPIKGTKNRTGFLVLRRDEDDVLAENFFKEARLVRN